MSETTAKPAPRQRKKAARFCRLTTTHAGTVALVIRQQQGTQAPQTDVYYLESIVSQMSSRGLLLHKHDGTSYAVNLSGTDSTCDCKGFDSHGHCKHVESLLALQQRGKL